VKHFEHFWVLKRLRMKFFALYFYKVSFPAWNKLKPTLLLVVACKFTLKASNERKKNLN
jgi:hypothetical protein